MSNSPLEQEIRAYEELLSIKIDCSNNFDNSQTESLP